MTLRETRIGKRIALREAAKQLGIGATRLSLLEAGLAVPTTTELGQIEAIFGPVDFAPAEEIEAAQREFAETNALMEKVSDLVNKDAKGRRSIAGKIECPKCKGRIRYSVAFNGHRTVVCENKCVGWIE